MNAHPFRSSIRILALSGAAALLLAGPGRARLQDAPPPQASQAPSVPDLARHGHPKLQGGLARLLDIEARAGASAAGAYALQRRMDWSDGRVRVVTTAAPSSTLSASSLLMPLMKSRIQSLGGTVELSYRRTVQHWIPVASLAALADDPMVRSVRLPLRPFRQRTGTGRAVAEARGPRAAGVTSEGVVRTGANQWHAQVPFRRTGAAKVAILDSGFTGYENLLGTDLPADVETRSFRFDGSIAGDTDHGAACAEIVHDMAPLADLLLVNFSTDVEQAYAVDWIVRQKAAAISYSLGWYNAGPGDGTGPIDDAVEYAVSHGTAWASSAGNAATDHWEGDFQDTDGDGWLDFSPGDEILAFNVAAYEVVGAFLNWKDWGVWDGSDFPGSAEDYDLVLWIWNGSAWQQVDVSNGDQTGTQWPTEEIYGYYANKATAWGVSIHRYSASKAVKLELFTVGNNPAIEYAVASRSTVVPAESPSALATGATDALTDGFHSYSGQGPTWAGLIKPDLSAPSGVTTTTYGYRNFYGTSASAPHLAGAIGLIAGMTPYSVEDAVAILKRRAVDLGAAGWDTLFGIGRLSLIDR